MKATFKNPEESLALIRSMIARTRQNFRHNSFYFLLWGILMFAGGLTEFFLLQKQFELFWIGWPILSIVGGIGTGIYASRKKIQSGGESYAETLIGYVWLTYGISLICMIVTGILTNTNPGILVMLLTGLPTFLTGRIIKHQPLIFGGVVFWIAGLTGLLVAPLYVPLIFSAAILLGYLFPGYTLLKVERTNHV